MLLPRFSTRTMLALTTVCACFSFVLAMAFRGEAWAIGFLSAVLCLVLMFALYGLTFLVALAISAVFEMLFTKKKAVSPFAGDSPPPQVIKPVEPD